MSRNWIAIEDTLYNWASTKSGVTTIWRHQNAPQPVRPYVVLHIDAVDTIQGSSPVESGPDADGKRTIYFTKDFLVSIMWIGGDDSTNSLDALLSTLWQSDVLDEFTKNDLIVIDWETAKDVTFTEQDHWIEKSTAVINCRTSFDHAYGPDTTTKTIETVNIVGTEKNGDTHTQNITVSTL
jgi:hypothetical protein